jgi:hypothetical protein
VDRYCLVLTGRLLEGQDLAAAHARMAAAFGMEFDDFRKRVFERAPLVIRRGLDQDTAQAQAAQLEQMGVEAQVVADDAPLVWLLRDGRTLGPLPQTVLSRYARRGDQWCHDGGQQWFPWQAPPLADATASSDVEPPPLPQTEPPPLPATALPAAAAASARTGVSGWAVACVVVAVLGLFSHPVLLLSLLFTLGVLLWLLRRPATRGRGWAATAQAIGVAGLLLWGHQAAPPSRGVAQAYVPRPLQPLNDQDEDDTEDDAALRANQARCAAAAPAPTADEDRFLLTGGQRRLTGRTQRKGDTYVAEAASGYDADCHPDQVQLYVFRHGVFIGTALDNAVSLASAKLTQFELSDEQHLRIILSPCDEKTGTCAGTPSTRQAELLHEAGGWIVRRASQATP